MKVTVICFGGMREYLPPEAQGNRAMIELPDGASVARLAEELGAPRRLLFSLLVDGARVGEEAVLTDGAEVTLMPPFTGGADCGSAP
jgi:molybdopterin converting factor small subunit